MAFKNPLKNPLKKRFKQWMERHNPPSSGLIRLYNRRLYILPTRFGVMYSFLLLVIFLAAINYQNSLSFALSFLLTGIAIISLWQTHKNMLNLEVELIKPNAVFADEWLDLTFIINNPHNFQHYSIGVQYQQAPPVYCSINARSKQALKLCLLASERGEFRLDGITFFTRFPTGLFHCWSWLQFTQSLTIYPKPIDASLDTYHAQNSDKGSSKIKTIDGDDFAGLRDFKEGESLKHIAWKALAQGRGKLSKTFQGEAQPSVWIDWFQVNANSLEEKISKLTSLILKADKLNQTYGLKTPQHSLAKGHGMSHKKQCLHVLACYKKTKARVFNAGE